MKKTVAILIMPLILAGFSGVTGCRQSAEKKEQKKVELEQVESLEQKIEENVYPLPTSAEVIKMLSELEVGYQFGISNPVENASKYITSTSRAINMGVFGADLSYCTIYNINQEVINYLNAIRTLANELNMSKIYDETLYDRIKDNFDNKDELVNLLTNAFNETYSYLSENDQQSLALLVVGGAWVEGMYLTCNVSEAAYQVAGISRNLLEQKKSFDLFMEVTKAYEADPAISDFLKKLEPISNVYKGLESSLTMQNIIDITNAINQVRAEIVK
ncbi:MAG: hypothetical protein JXR66_00740 [Bacteroidales bacterium]|nr:hypothetical protein [Bacteroidales bacterium]MBN2632050.1 hypothetical protein [Bacteroidales bacterium]